jgi:transcriptional regulator GlxA family with amidase domain
MKTHNVGILIFDNVEVLDFSGPFEAFNAANEILRPSHVRRGDGERSDNDRLFKVFTVAENEDMVMAKFGYYVKPHFSINNSPDIDILVIPGGEGRKVQMNNPVITGWVKNVFDKLEILLTVCTGVFIAGKSGVLNVKQATTHHGSYDEFEKTFPGIELVKNVKFVDNGIPHPNPPQRGGKNVNIITAGGISAGINASLYVIDKLVSNEHGKKTAAHMEYDY